MNTKEKDIFPELSKFKDAGHSLISAMNMASRSLVDFAKERDRLLAEIEQLKKERAELEAERDDYTGDTDGDYNIYDQFIKESNELWQLITRLCLNANPPIRVREHTIKSLKEAGVQVKGRISKLELWRGDELVGVIINTSQNKWE